MCLFCFSLKQKYKAKNCENNWKLMKYIYISPICQTLDSILLIHSTLASANLKKCAKKLFEWKNNSSFLLLPALSVFEGCKHTFTMRSYKLSKKATFSTILIIIYMYILFTEIFFASFYFIFSFFAPLCTNKQKCSLQTYLSVSFIFLSILQHSRSRIH